MSRAHLLNKFDLEQKLPMYVYRLTSNKDAHGRLANLIVVANSSEYAGLGTEEFDFIYDIDSGDLWFAVSFTDKNAALQWRLTIDKPEDSLLYYGDGEQGYDAILEQLKEQ